MREDEDPAVSSTVDDELPEDVRIQVRGTADNKKTEEQLSQWEKAVRDDAAVNGGTVPPKTSRRSMNLSVRLTEAPDERPPPGDTESELNGLISECRYLMREIAFKSARLTYDPDDRIRFLSSAQGLALTASKIAKSVAVLRNAGRAPGPVETHRHEMVYTHVSATSPLPTPGADSAKQ